MRLLPWVMHRRASARDAESAQEAVRAARAEEEAAAPLARDLARIVRENNFSPRIRAAFHARPGGAS